MARFSLKNILNRVLGLFKKVIQQQPSIKVANSQYQGLRDYQEDTFGFSLFKNHEFVSHGGHVAVIADGMGGLEYGADASHIAVQTFLNAYQKKTSKESIPKALQRSAEIANKKVFEFAKKYKAIGRTGTTLVVAVIYEDRLMWVSFGDSRLYLCQKDQNITLLTDDQSYFNAVLKEQVRLGEISEDEATNHPKANALTNYLGRESLLPPSLSPDEGIQLKDGDWLVLCSDGLNQALSDTEIVSEIQDSAERSAFQLIQEVKNKKLSYQDNTTVLVVQFTNTLKIHKPTFLMAIGFFSIILFLCLSLSKQGSITPIREINTIPQVVETKINNLDEEGVTEKKVKAKKNKKIKDEKVKDEKAKSVYF